MALLCRWVVPLDARAPTSVFYPCSPYFTSPLIPLYCGALKWLSLHALCAHPTLTSSFFQLQFPLFLPLELFAKFAALIFPSNSWHSCLRFFWLFLSVFLSVCPSFFLHCPTLSISSPDDGSGSGLRYSAGPASAISQFALQALTHLGSQVISPTLFYSHTCLSIPSTTLCVESC